jgi:WD40 repeat protein
VTSQAGAVVSCAEFSSDGSRFATLTYEGIIQIWNAQSGLQIALFAAPLDLSIGGSLNVKYSPDDRRLVNTASGVIWSTEPVALPYHTAEVGTAIFSPNGRRILTASSDSTARIWDAFNVSIMPLVLVHGGPVRDATFSPDGKRVVTASADRTAKIWDADSGKLISTLSGHRGEVSQAVFSPDGLRVVTGSPGAPVPTDNTARIWDAQTGRLIATLQHEDGMLVRFSYDGSQVITTSTDEVRTWDALTGKRLVESEKDKEVAFSRSTKRLLLKRSESVVLVDSETGREIAVLGQISNATFTEDGRQIMGISTEDVQSWDSETGKLTGRFARPLATGTFYIAPNGRTALTEITGEGLMLWDVHRSKRITILTAGASDTITYGDFSPDGKRVLTTGSSARLFYLPSNPQDIEESRDALLRCLTPAQRKEYFLGPTPPDWCIKTGKWPYARRQ